MSKTFLTRPEFGLDLLCREAAAKPGQNVFISPLSIATCLGLILNAADKNTAAQMVSALGVHETISVYTITSELQQLLSDVCQMSADVQLKIANALVAKRGEPVYRKFLETAKLYLDAGVFAEDFDSATIDDINSWVNENTDGMIVKIIEDIDPNSIMFALNAVFLDAPWTTPFDVFKTRHMVFHTSTETKHHPLMYLDTRMSALETSEFEAVMLPFGTSQSAQYFAFMPKEGVAMETVLAALRGKGFATVAAAMKPEQIQLRMPKFRIAYENSLVSTLRLMGMNDAFSEALADFSNLRPIGPNGPNVFLADVLHKAVGEFTEERARCAATTVGRLSLESCMMSFGRQVTFDRPFVLLITSTYTEAALFAGIINDPEQIEDREEKVEAGELLCDGAYEVYGRRHEAHLIDGADAVEEVLIHAESDRGEVLILE